MVISSKKLVQMAKRWTRATGAPRGVTDSPDSAPAKGHLAVYTKDGARFVVPLKWLASNVFGEMLEMAEEEFGLPRDGPITLTIDAFFMEEVVRLMKGRNRFKGGSGSDLSMRSLSGGRCSETPRWPTEYIYFSEY